MTIPWILISILVALALLGIIMILALKGKKPKTDYYSLFIMGVIWAGAGIPLKNYILSAMGIIFMIVGAVHRKEWHKHRKKLSQLNKKERRIRIIILILLSILVLLGVAAFILQAM